MSGALRVCSAGLAGLVFGIGLSVSGMINPAKVTGFLDLTGNWDPSLALVMGGALAVNLLATQLILKRESPVFDVQFFLPTRADIDLPLVGGAILFGMGWGIAGYCPGPLLTSLSFVNTDIAVTFIAFVAGTLVAKYLTRGR